MARTTSPSAADDPVSPAGGRASSGSPGFAPPEHPGSSVPAPSAAIQQSSPPRTRLRAGVIAPVNYKVKFGLACSTGESSTFREACTDPKWRQAMGEEFQALQRNKTWHLVPAQHGKNLIIASGCSG